MEQPTTRPFQDDLEAKQTIEILRKRIDELDNKLKAQSASDATTKNDERKVTRWLQEKRPPTGPHKLSMTSEDTIPNDTDRLEQYVGTYVDDLYTTVDARGRDSRNVAIRVAKHGRDASFDRIPETAVDDSESSSNKSSQTYVRQDSLRYESKLLECLSRVDKTMAEIADRFAKQKRAEQDANVVNARTQPELYLPVELTTESSFKAFHGWDLTSTELRKGDPALPKQFSVLKTKKVSELAADIIRHFNLRAGRVRMWVMTNRHNKTVRPEQPLDDPDMLIEDAYVKYTPQKEPFKIYAEEQDQELTDQGEWNCPALVFLKCFDVERQTLTGICHTYAHKRARIADIGHTIVERMKWPCGTEVKLFEEVKHNIVEPLKPKKTFGQAEIQDGDIIVFQRVVPEEVLTEEHITDIQEFYNHLYHQKDVRFTPVKSGRTFNLTLNGKMNYEQWSAKVGQYLKVDPSRLRFAPVSSHTGQPKPFVKHSTTRNLSYILRGTSAFYESMHRREEYLYYEILEESVSEYETKKLLKATWLCDGIGNELLMDLLVPEDGTIADVKAKLRKRLGSEVEHVQKIRVFEVFQDKIHRELGDEFFVETFSEKTNLYAEPVPEEELEIKEGEYTIDSFNFDTDVAKTHSIPFKFLLKPGEKLADAKARLSERTNLRGETFDKIRIAIVPDAPDEPPVYLSDEDVITDVVGRFSGCCQLGLDHVENHSIIL